MRIKQYLIDSITPYPGNPRVNKHAVSKVADSLREFGWQQPIVVDEDNIVIVGHTRLLAAKKLDMKKVPILVASDLSPAQVKAYRIADNRTGEEAEWDMKLLTIEIDGLKGMDFDLDVLGFEQVEMDELFPLAEREGLTDDDAVPDVPDEPVTKLGDVWLLGAYFVCGDCNKKYEYNEGLKIKECPCDL